jgi:hypothetical protein
MKGTVVEDVEDELGERVELKGLTSNPKDSLSDSLQDSLYYRLRNSLWNSLWISLGVTIGSSLRDSLDERNRHGR